MVLECLCFAHVLQAELANVQLWLLFILEGVRAVVPGIDGTPCDLDLFDVLYLGGKLVLPLKFSLFWTQEWLNFSCFVLLVSRPC